ncbi:clostripain-related cysteine peptidase [Pedobacter sp.]|uniref:clostripain-related cysteine peptidase n=1 Tax=Pedobacter sp. TaxID=1411316 RepID=UPI003D7FCEA3
MSPANSYWLVLWSHATSWAPPTGRKTKSFGSDNNQEMDIIDFRNAIPSDFEYIMFAACSTGSVEVVYELQEKARYILFSPSAVPSASFPYEAITPHFFVNTRRSKDNLQRVYSIL